MNNKDRLINFMIGKETDRAPFPMWLGFNPWRQTLERWKEESGISDLNPNTYFDFDPFFAVVNAEYGPFPHFKTKVIEETDEHVISINQRGITTKGRRDGGSIPEFLDYPIHTPDDWVEYKDTRLQPQLTGRLVSFENQLKYLNDETPIQVGTFPWGVFGSIRDLVGAEALLLGFYDYPDMIKDMVESFTTLWLSLYEEISSKVEINHIHIWEDMSGKQGSLLSMDMVREFMMPQYDRIHDFAQKHNVPLISVDSDGRVDELIPVMTEHGINTFFPFEVQAGNNIIEYRKLYPELCIMGGLDKNALAKSKVDIHAELNKATEMLELGRYIVGFDHLIPPDVPWKNFKYAVNEIKKIIGL